MIKNKTNYTYLLYFSFLPLIFQGVRYLGIGYVYPVLIAFLLVGGTLYVLHYKKKWSAKSIKIWCLLLLGYAFMRVALSLLVAIDNSGVPSGIFYKMTSWYHIKTFLFFVLGYLCFTKRKLYFLT